MEFFSVVMFMLSVSLLKISFKNQPMLFTLMFMEMSTALLFISLIGSKPQLLGLSSAVMFLALAVLEGVSGLLLVVSIYWDGVFTSKWSSLKWG